MENIKLKAESGKLKARFALLGVLSLFLTSFIFADNIEDTSIIDELNKNKPQVSTSLFKLETFESCNDMQSVMKEYIKLYWENTRQNNYYPVSYKQFENALVMKDTDAISSSDVAALPTAGGGGIDYSETNIQVQGVDESDIIKTDGKNIFYYNSKDNYVYVVSIADKKVVKKIKIPTTSYSPVLYLSNGKLTIISNGYADYDYSSKGYWINRNLKTFVINYDVANVDSPKLEKIYIVDGSLVESRKIGDYVYVISNNYFSVPYYAYNTFDDADFSISKIMPQKIDVSVNSATSKYTMDTGNVADCNSISYALPDAETIGHFNLAPSYNVISVIDTKNPNGKVSTNVIAGNISEVYMSLDNLYFTSYIYRNGGFEACPRGANCILPRFTTSQNTLVHKLNVNGNKINYQNSTILPGTPLTQYSMDEYKENFRIITQTNSWTSSSEKNYVDLYILDKNLNLIGSLEKLGEGEVFRASRYIGEKLFLVTFEQTDPLFAIDVSNPKAPKVLGELKIPGYSTYLHPYDDNHLIGLGYDTTENQYGNIVQAGLKVDLYEINYNKNCGDTNLTVEEKTKCNSGDYKGIIVKQLYSKVLGGQGSSSEATNNPRMFMWNANEKKLFLPITLYDRDDNYRNKDYFQGLSTLTIDKNTGIKEDYRITHIDTTGLEAKRLEECEKYSTGTSEPLCRKLITGEEYCSTNNRYVPTYCYADSTVGEYMANQSWNYRDSFINRALWVGKEVFAISNNEISAHDMSSGKEEFKVEMR